MPSMYTALPLAIQTAYQDLLDRHRRKPTVSIEGSLIQTERAGQKYWVARHRNGGRVREAHIGPDNPEVVRRIHKAQAEQKLLEAWRSDTASLVAQLRAARANTLDMQTGKIIAALARVGFFRAGGVLAGTHAFALYELELGVRFNGVIARTEDVDLLAASSINVVADGVRGLPALLEDLNLKPIVSVGDAHPHRWASGDGTPIDILTPLKRGGHSIVELKGLGLHAQALPYLQFAIAETIEAVGLYREGILVRVPAPQRYAVHKLIVASERTGSFRAKSAKDLEQSEALISVMAEQRPFELRSAYNEAIGYGPKWRKAIARSLERAPRIVEALSQL
ncbi:MAG: hypothetical protein B7Y90_12645 [Alphaproteobacteria bacterium 32-64-14]|nr:MAG: hypothetical protein B7Y90_12645 [Alphaproteobacteria bacterium 32-64-14]